MSANRKLKVIVDSCCDIPVEYEKLHRNLEILPIPITIDGRGYYERKDFTSDEFIKMMATSKNIPSTSHITSLSFLESFNRAAHEGFEDILVITLSSTGSNMIQAAAMARDMFFEDASNKERYTISVVDSKTYAIVFGYGVMRALELTENGSTIAEIVEELEDYYSRVEIYLGLFNLDYAKRSGRISSAAGFVGELLGLRPIISIIDGITKVEEKVRGDKNVIPKLISWYKKRNMSDGYPYMCVYGENKENGKILVQEMAKAVGYPCVGLYQLGASVLINAGPTLIGFTVMGPKRDNLQKAVEIN